MKKGDHPVEEVYRSVHRGPKTHRIVLDFSPEQYAALEEIMEEAGMESIGELCDWAVTLLEWAADQKKVQSQVVSVNPETKRRKTLHMPCLDFVAMANQPVKGPIH
jgi:hypothetical protein